MRRATALACALLSLHAPFAFAQHAGHVMPPGRQEKPQATTVVDHSPYSTTKTPGKRQQDAADPVQVDHAGHEAPDIDHSKMDQSQHRVTPSSPPPLPAPTAEERAAAFPDLHGMDMRDHMDDDPLVTMLQFDQLEWQDDGDASGIGWDLRGWAGYSFNKLWLRSEGERRNDRTERGDVEVLWSHAKGPWWDAVVGVRHDFGAGPARDWLAIGVQGLAPYKFEVEATGYVGSSGRLAVRFEAEYNVLLSNRLILQPKGEVELYSRDDVEAGVGKGLSEVELGLRLRYEFHRQFAPYLGYVWSRKFGDTAAFAVSQGRHRSEQLWIAGIRVWF